ncbi:MAG: RNA methyltransferase [Actinobacteria bacterium]|nr:RNA methyltransferase [Actinomycetota bacterium]
MQWRQRMEPAQGLFLAEGEKVIQRALQAGYRPRSVLLTSRWLAGLSPALQDHDIEVLLADEATLRSIVGFRLHRGALAAFERRAHPPMSDVLASARRLVVLENLVDHTNVGLVFRTAAALGVDAILVSPSCADPYYRRSVKTSMGAVLSLPWTIADPWPATLDSLRRDGWLLAALTPSERAVELAAFVRAEGAESKLALLLGSEGPGLTAEAAQRCTVALRIPVTDRVDSLNVAAAAAIACYELAQVSRSPNSPVGKCGTRTGRS